MRLAEWVAANENFDSELRESAVEISDQIQGLLPIELDTSYEHDRFGTEPRDVYRRLRAFEVSFDGPDDDDDEDGTGDIWRIPHFVTSEVRSIDESDEVEDGRRSTRFRVDEELNNEGLAPADTDYRGSGYDRGHLMPHRLAGRLGSYAQQNTMSMINVAPQVPRLNRYVWNDLERKTFEWVEEYRRIWFIAGPIFYDKTPRNWINREIPIAVPDAYFKIVVKEGTKPDRPDVLAFIYPNNAELLTERNPSNYLVSVGEIEQKTKLRFFTRLPESSRNAILNQQATEIWD